MANFVAVPPFKRGKLGIEPAVCNLDGARTILSQMRGPILTLYRELKSRAIQTGILNVLEQALSTVTDMEGSRTLVGFNPDQFFERGYTVMRQIKQVLDMEEVRGIKE